MPNPFGAGIRPWKRMTTALATASNAVLGAGEILVDEAGNVYGGNGAVISSLKRLTRKDELDLKAALASPTLTGTPLVPTAVKGTNSQQIASTAFVTGAITDLLGPGVLPALDTLVEIGAQLGADENTVAVLTANVATRLQLVQPTTTYSAGALAVNPSGQIVSANANFTTGATYDASAWTITAGYDGGTTY